MAVSKFNRTSRPDCGDHVVTAEPETMVQPCTRLLLARLQYSKSPLQRCSSLITEPFKHYRRHREDIPEDDFEAILSHCSIYRVVIVVGSLK